MIINLAVLFDFFIVFKRLTFIGEAAQRFALPAVGRDETKLI